MIEIKDIVKRYPKAKVNALDHVDLTIESGEFFGLLGPNGAGKTTLINLLATLLYPTEGSIYIDGELLQRSRNDIKRKLSLITQHNSLRNDMTLDEIMELQGRLYYMKTPDIRAKSAELLDFCGLTEHRKKTVRKLSGGMKRKLMICRALLTDPEILILDEPTVGLDPSSRRQIWDLTRAINRQGRTVILTTHYMDEAQQLCSRIAMIDKGRVAGLDSPENFIKRLGEYAVDAFEDEHTVSSFFATQQEAIDFASSASGKVAMRSTTLEDVFLNEVGRGLTEK